MYFIGITTEIVHFKTRKKIINNTFKITWENDDILKNVLIYVNLLELATWVIFNKKYCKYHYIILLTIKIWNKKVNWF